MGCYAVTRAEPGASATAARIEALGHTVVLAPMLSIEFLAVADAPDHLAGVLFTSANGVRAFARAHQQRDVPAYCVGDATAAAARAAGFLHTFSASGDVEALAAHVTTHATPRAGALLHAAGADLAGDLEGRLRQNGFTVETRTYYKAVESLALSPVLEAALTSSSPRMEGVLFHSARAAATFVRAIEKQMNAKESLARITAFCMSDAVADSARGAIWKQILVATEPQDAALLALLPCAAKN